LDLSDSDLMDTALFVRDAAGLLAPGSLELPPALEGPLVDHRRVLSERDRATASMQWGGWWRRIVEVEFGARRPLGRSSAGQLGPAVIADLRAVSDPPEFTALAHVPELRAAARASFDDAVRWQRRRDVSRYEAVMEWPMVAQAVEDVAFDRRVPVDVLSAAIMVLPVAGAWWRGVGPGQMLCSEHAARRPRTAYQILYEVFATSLDR
jgi:hypothetical protein